VGASTTTGDIASGLLTNGGVVFAIITPHASNDTGYTTGFILRNARRIALDRRAGFQARAE
jgi:hypothetical protein